MALVVTPGQLVQRAQFYHQLGQLTAAGLPIIGVLEMLARNPPSRAFREPIQQIVKQLSQGSTVAEAWQNLGRWVPAFDVALVHAGEQSGRLDAVFKILAQHYDERAVLLRRIISDLLYPLFVFHFAVILFPFLDWFKGGVSVTHTVMKILIVLVPIYGGVLLLIFASQGRRGATWRAWLERLSRPIPVLGAARHYLALARLSAALEALINAGVSIIEAWEVAAAASGSPAILRVVQDWRQRVTAGQTPSEAINQVPAQFPEVFANLYFSGEASGQLDDSLRRLHKYYQEEATSRMQLLAKWVPQLIYYGVAAMVAFKVISFYTGYFNDVRKAGGF